MLMKMMIQYMMQTLFHGCKICSLQMQMLVVMIGMEGLGSGHGAPPCTGPGMPLLLVTHPLVGDPLAANQHRAAAVVRQPGAG